MIFPTIMIYPSKPFPIAKKKENKYPHPVIPSLYPGSAYEYPDPWISQKQILLDTYQLLGP